jgi:hypothetical protein
MKAQLGAALLALPLLGLASGCNEAPPAASGKGPAGPVYENGATNGTYQQGARAVRIGELGPSFPACYAMARLRERVVTEPVPVRDAPFADARETARIAPGTQFFICTRSHDQRWFAIVWDEAAGASQACGVSRPVSARRDYAGPCSSGWIPSALVRLESGIIHADPAPPAPSR